MSWEDYRDRVAADARSALPGQVARLRADPATVAALQADGLRRLLDHAIANSPFHRERLAGIDPAEVRPDNLAALPIMTKGQMMSSIDDVYTDPRLRHERVEAALADSGDHPAPIDDEFVSLATGGTSGRRASITFDRAGLLGYLGALARPMAARLQEVAGDGPLPELTLAMVAAGTARHATHAMTHFAAGALPFRFHHIPVTTPLPEIVAQLNALQPPVLMGYASAIHRLAGEQRAGRLQIAPLSVSATSETLDGPMRDAISEAFGVAPVNTFGSTEGLVGASPPGGEAIVFNTDLCIVELVDDAYRPVPIGTPSTRILVTNLYNLAQPLIRYEIGDHFQQVPDPNGGGLLHAIVHGRNEPPLRFGSVEVHPHAITTVMVGATAVLDYQVRQIATGVDVDVIAADDLDAAVLKDALQVSLRRSGLVDPTVDVTRVSELKRDPRTGKARRFVREIAHNRDEG